MKTMTIRGLPSEVHARLKARAKQNRRSLNQEVIAELSGGDGFDTLNEVERKRARAEQMLARAREFRKGMRTFLTAEEIDAAIKEGRK